MRRPIRPTLLLLVAVAMPLAAHRAPIEAAQSVACPPPLVEVEGGCVHGSDPPDTFSDPFAATPIPDDLLTASPSVCVGTGSDGPRVQVLYARASDRASRFSAFVGTFRQIALDANYALQQSAGETGGKRTIRFLHDAGCVIDVREAVMTATGDDDFASTIRDLKSLGYNRTDRRYLVFVDNRTDIGNCGVGHVGGTGSGLPDGLFPLYTRVDAVIGSGTCWNAHTALHELTHTLGAVQDGTGASGLPGAPHATANHHCTDDYDVMCYDDNTEDGDPADGGTADVVCADTAHEQRLDCNHDDYFRAGAAASTIGAAHLYNTADSIYLEDNALDTTPPSSVAVTAPAASATITATSYSVTASATDVGSGVTAMTFWWCQSSVCTAFGRDIAAPWAFTWNTGARANGSYTIKVSASDATGNRRVSPAVAVTLNH